MEDHPLSAVHDSLLNIFAASLHTGGRSSIRNLRTRHALVTGTHLPRINSTLTQQLAVRYATYCNFYTCGPRTRPQSRLSAFAKNVGRPWLRLTLPSSVNQADSINAAILWSDMKKIRNSCGHFATSCIHGGPVLRIHR